MYSLYNLPIPETNKIFQVLISVHLDPTMHSFSSFQLSLTKLHHNLYPVCRSIFQSHLVNALHKSPKSIRLSHQPLRIRSIHAAQPIDSEVQLLPQVQKSRTLKIAIVGFGNFGQFIAKTFVNQGHTVIAHSRTDYSDVAGKLGVTFYSDPHDLCEQHPEVVIISTSILSLESVIKSLPFQRLRRNTLFVDVLSVKEFPRDILVKHLPIDFDIMCTHLMFGPDSGKHSWNGLPFVYEKVRIGNSEIRQSRCEKFIEIFNREGCKMVEMSCAEHDRYAAESQFITHTLGRLLEKFGLESSPINTKGYEKLLDLVESTSGDSFNLYYGLFIYNNNAIEQLERLEMAFESLKKDLFEKLHQVYRKQMFGDLEVKPLVQKLLPNGARVDMP